MIKINTNKSRVGLICHKSPYSIIKKDEDKIILSNGYNELDGIKYGFYFDYSCNNQYIESMDLSGYDTSKIIDMGFMFANCQFSSIVLNNFNVRNVTCMRFMFNNCYNLTSLDLSSFNTSNVENIVFMFSDCRSLRELDLSNFNVRHLKTCYGLFYGCWSLHKIRCTKEFKNWCIENQDEIDLPNCLCEGGNGIWDIVK